MKKKNTISIAIIARNEEKMIAEAIKSALWADQVLVLDTGSEDKTGVIAKKLGAEVIKIGQGKQLAFSQWRTRAIKETRGDWLLYLDADERITPQLRKEITELIKKGSDKYTAYAIPRANYYLGERVKYGGSWPDYVKRLYWKKSLKKWRGDLHEEPVFQGELGHLKNPLEHYTHRDLTSMVEKTIKWSRIEAELLDQAGHPPMTWWRFFRPMVSEFYQREIRKQGFRDGVVGLIEVIFQVFSRFITYARLWEIQEKRKKL